MTGTFGQSCDQIVAVAELPIGEQTRNDLARRVVAAAHAATVQPASRTDDPVAAHHLNERSNRALVSLVGFFVAATLERVPHNPVESNQPSD